MHLVVLLLALLHLGAAAQPNYAKSAEIPPLRVSFAEIQSILDKLATLARAANAGTQPRHEQLVVKAGPVQITLPGHALAPAGARVPERIEALTYTYLAAEGSAVTRIYLDFGDYRRTVSVEGPTPEQVDAIFATAREDLNAMSTPIGGSGLRTLLGFPAYWILMLIVGWSASSWFASRASLSLAIALSAASLIALLLLLPTDDLLAGFWAVRGEASFMIRYGPHMSFIGFVLAVVGVPALVQQFRPKTVAAKVEPAPATRSSTSDQTVDRSDTP